MSDENEKGFREFVKDVQLQWFFILLGSMLAVVLGVCVNAIYDLMRDLYGAGGTLLIFALPAILLIDGFSYMFGYMERMRETPDESFLLYLNKYFLARRDWIFRRKNSGHIVSDGD